MSSRLLLLASLILGLVWAPVSSAWARPADMAMAASDMGSGGDCGAVKTAPACHVTCALCHAAVPRPPASHSPQPIRIVLKPAVEAPRSAWSPSLDPPPPKPVARIKPQDIHS